MTRIKICGILETGHALAAAEAGADYIGMVFAESRRKITVNKALAISRALSALKNRPQLVGVFAGTPVTEVNRIAGICCLDRVQLSGGEAWRDCQQTTHPMIKAIHISPGMTATEVMAVIEEGSRMLKNQDYTFLLDTGTGKAFGGTGQTFNWMIAKEVAGRYPVIIAGGLTPDNVAELIRQVQPFAVDVSGGVESGGIKDPNKIRAFIKAVKQIDAFRGTRRKL